MKGTIDITIKRKDGTVEKRQEHNVAFDLPAFILKEYLKSPILPIYASSVNMSYLKDAYKTISLSEEERDLTKPEWRPRALKTIASGSSMVWHTALASATNNGKKRTVTTAWTMPSDEGFSLTLKSIAFDNPNYMASRGYRYSSDNKDQPLFTKDIAQLQAGSDYNRGSYYYGKKWKKSDFSFENTLQGGFANANFVATDTMYMPYSMGLVKTVDGVQTRTNDGRFAFINNNNVISARIFPTSATDKIAIFDDTTEQIVLSFSMSQFTNWTMSYYNYTYIINTGTKNWLFQYDSSISASRIWQIPDTQTNDAIAPTNETFLQGVALSPLTNTDSVNDGIGIIGNYIVNKSKVYKISDDLTVVESGGGDTANTGNGYVQYLDKDYVSFYASFTAGRGGSGYVVSSAEHGLLPYFANLTASNFSTPITLGAGDVLSVSYSISVA